MPPQGEPANRTPPQATRRTKWIVLGVASIAGLIAVYLLFFHGSSSVQMWRDETRTITLTRSLHPKRLVFENDVVQISIGYDQFLDYIAVQSRQAEADSVVQKGLQEWQAQVDRELSHGDAMQLAGYRIEGVVANLLETGQAAVFDKRSQSYVNTIQRRTYEYGCGPLCCGGFYYFHLPDRNLFNPNGTQFLEWQYMIC